MNRVENLTKISQGNNSEIYLWKCQSQENLRNLVLKVVDLSYPDQANILINEFSILKNLHHENILKVIDLKKDMQILGSRKHVLITEYAPRASLFDLLVEKKSFDIRIVRSFFKQISSAIQYLHSNSICHRDIKLENVLVFNDFSLKLADFGFSKQLLATVAATAFSASSQITGVNQFQFQSQQEQESDYNYNNNNSNNSNSNNSNNNGNHVHSNNSNNCCSCNGNYCNTYQGTKRGYMPPEILRLQVNKGRVPYCGYKADIFSLGVLLFVLVFGYLPFERSRETDRQFRCIITKNYNKFWQMFREDLDALELQPGAMVPELKQLLESMMSFNPEERPTCEEVLSHPWIEGSILDPQSHL